QVAATDEVTEPVRVLVADDGVMQDEQTAAGFDELPKMRLPFRRDLRGAVVEHERVVASAQVLAKRLLVGDRVIPGQAVLLEEGVEGRGIVVPARDHEEADGCRHSERGRKSAKSQDAEVTSDQHGAPPVPSGGRDIMVYMQVAVITGAAQGIGRQIARVLAARGHTLAVDHPCSPLASTDPR